MSGKGSSPRPYSVDLKTFEKNWENIFNKKTNDLCDNASELNKDWYLTAINPWYKMYINAKTGERKKIPYK